MILQLTIQTDPEKLKDCICSAWQLDSGDPLHPSLIKPFKVGDKVLSSDVENMTKGSCLAELIKGEDFVMEVIE